MTDTIELTYQAVVEYDEKLAEINLAENKFIGAESSEDSMGVDPT